MWENISKKKQFDDENENPRLIEDFYFKQYNQ